MVFNRHRRNQTLFGVLLWLLSVLIASPLHAAPTKPLPVDQAFIFSATVKDPHTLQLHWQLAPGYYLYKDRISYKVVSPPEVSLGKIILPQGLEKHDQILGNYKIFKNNLTFDLPLNNVNGKAVMLKVCYQGCSDDNFCYPPETKQVTVHLNDPPGTRSSAVSLSSAKPAKQSNQNHAYELLLGHNFFLVTLSFLGFGLLLAFTPCVLPMLPILSGIIIGHGEKITTRKAFLLSLTYVLSMSVTYAIAGVLISLLGANLQVAMQNPWVIGSFSAVFVLLALSLFGFYELQLPSRFQARLTNLSNKQQSGHYLGAAIMGCLATLIVSPCVTAPLVGALAYISQSGDALLGGSALFAMGFGMGIPLLIVGTSGGKLLPKAGSWMDTVKAGFGVLMLAIAIWMLSRIIPGPVTLVLYGALFIICAVHMGLLQRQVDQGWPRFWQGIGLVFAVYGSILLIGASLGNHDPFKPLHLSIVNTSSTTIAQGPWQFIRIKSNNDFDQELANAIKADKPVMLDFYADWCIACKEMEANAFSDPEVKQQLKQFVTLQADVTANDIIDKHLQERLGVIAPPTILFFDAQGNELSNQRIVGEMKTKAFLEHLHQLPLAR